MPHNIMKDNPIVPRNTNIDGVVISIEDHIALHVLVYNHTDKIFDRLFATTNLTRPPKRSYSVIIGGLLDLLPTSIQHISPHLPQRSYVTMPIFWGLNEACLYISLLFGQVPIM